MSELSNPSANAGAGAAAYTAALLERLGNRDPLDVMRSTPDAIRIVIAELDEQQLQRPEREGKWSIADVLRHLSDTELVVATRLRFAVAQDDPPIVGFDQDAWVARLWKGDEPADEILSQFEALRWMNLRFLSRLADEAWERAGIHAERGRETVRQMVKLCGGHDLAHRSQIERICERYEETP